MVAPTPSITYLLPTPRVLSEINQRISTQRVSLDLSKLCLNELPPQFNLGQRGGAKKEGEAKETITGGNPTYLKGLHLTLRSLNLEFNPLQNLHSGSLFSFTKLEELNLNHCELIDLPGAFKKFHNLAKFYLFNNHLSAVPGVISTLTNLVELNLGGNNISEIKWNTFTPLVALTDLTLANNRISSFEIPSGSGDLSAAPIFPPSLKSLNMNNNQLEFFPLILLRLPRLVTLELRSNRISSVPSDFESFESPDGNKTLEWLDLSDNYISFVPDVFIEYLETLTWISFESNDLTEIPQSIIQKFGHQEKSKGKAKRANFSANPLNAEQISVTSSCIIVDNKENQESNGIANGVAVSSDVTSIPPYTRAISLSSSLTSQSALTINAAVSPSSASIISSSSSSSSNSSSSSPSPPVIPPSLVSLPVYAWTSVDIASLVKFWGFESYGDAFQSNEITGSTIFDLDKGDLKELGITKVGHQISIMKAIQSLKGNGGPSAAMEEKKSPPRQTEKDDEASKFLTPNKQNPHSVTSPSSSSSMNILSHPPTSPGAPSASNSSSSPCSLNSCEVLKSSLLSTLKSSPSIQQLMMMKLLITLVPSHHNPRPEGAGDVANDEKFLQQFESGDSPFEHPTVVKCLNESKRIIKGTGPFISPFEGIFGGLNRGEIESFPLLPSLYLIGVLCLYPDQGYQVIEYFIKTLASQMNIVGGKSSIVHRYFLVQVEMKESTDKKSIFLGDEIRQAMETFKRKSLQKRERKGKEKDKDKDMSKDREREKPRRFHNAKSPSVGMKSSSSSSSSRPAPSHSASSDSESEKKTPTKKTQPKI